MRKKLHLPISVLIIAAAVFWQFYGSMPQNIEADPSASTEFSTRSAFEHVKVLGQQPHYVGSKTHSFARNYILTQLQELGLQAEVQEGYSLSKEGILTKPQNILARIEGSGTGKDSECSYPDFRLYVNRPNNVPGRSVGVGSNAGSGKQ